MQCLSIVDPRFCSLYVNSESFGAQKLSEGQKLSGPIEMPASFRAEFFVFLRGPVRLSPRAPSAAPRPMPDPSPSCCDHVVPNCQGSSDEGNNPGSRLCPKCCQAFIEGGEVIPPGPLTRAICMVKMHDLKFVVLKADGEAVVNWSEIQSEARCDAAMAKYKTLLVKPTTTGDKHPPEKRDDAGRTFSNAYVVHAYSAVVSFIVEKKLKPRGAELHPYLAAAWQLFLEQTAPSS